MHDDIGLRRLQRFGCIVLHAHAEPAVESDHIAEIAAGLAGIDVDGADDLEARASGNLSGDGAPIGPRPKCSTRMVGMARKL